MCASCTIDIDVNLHTGATKVYHNLKSDDGL